MPPDIAERLHGLPDVPLGAPLPTVSNLTPEVSLVAEIKGFDRRDAGVDIEKGFILTYNQEEELEEDGLSIKILPVWRWLLGGIE